MAKKPAVVKIANATIHDSGPLASETKNTSIADDWDAKDHLQTLSKAHEIMNDPKKMGKVQKLMKHQKKAIRSVDDIKEYAQQKYGKPGAMSSNPGGGDGGGASEAGE